MPIARAIPLALLLLGPLLLGLASGLPAAAQGFPSRPITIVVPYAPGTSDQQARAFGEHMGKQLGQTVLVENRAGAGGAVGAQFVAKQARADGHTLLFSASGALTVAPHQRDLPYKLDDLVPVGLVTTGPHYLAASSAAAFKDLAGLLDYARKNPGKVTYGSAGVGSATHLAGEAFARAAGIELNHIPFQGVTPAVTAAVGGTIDLVLGLPQAIEPQVQGGKLVAIAQFGAARAKGIPKVQTLKEGGVPLELAPLFGVWAPKDVPKPVLAILEAALEKAVKSPEFVELGERTQTEVSFRGSAEFAALLAAEDKFNLDLLTALGLAKK
jgi:tripartite-type tricarboxylate transporter receptor subunit TctC